RRRRARHFTFRGLARVPAKEEGAGVTSIDRWRGSIFARRGFALVKVSRVLRKKKQKNRNSVTCLTYMSGAATYPATIAARHEVLSPNPDRRLPMLTKTILITALIGALASPAFAATKKHSPNASWDVFVNGQYVG